MPPTSIRVAVDRDLGAIRRIHSASWQSAYATMLPAAYLDAVPERHAAQWAQLPAAATTLVAEGDDGDGDVCGFACVQPGVAPFGEHLLDNLHIDPARRGGGIGAALLRRVLEVTGEVTPDGTLYLWVFEANVNGRRFYAREGGTEAETRIEHLTDDVEVLERRIWWRLGG